MFWDTIEIIIKNYVLATWLEPKDKTTITFNKN
jgi:hypothetical protein